MKYKAYLNFQVAGDDDQNLYKNSNLPVAAFQVDGGASRIIKLKSTDDISLVSELEQARTFGNLYFYLSGTKGSKDMKAAVDLNAIAHDETTFQLLFIVERYSGGKLLEGLGLYCPNGLLKSPPSMAVDDTLLVPIDLTEGTEIYRGKIRNHNMPTVTEI